VYLPMLFTLWIKIYIKTLKSGLSKAVCSKLCLQYTILIRLTYYFRIVILNIYVVFKRYITALSPLVTFPLKHNATHVVFSLTRFRFVLSCYLIYPTMIVFCYICLFSYFIFIYFSIAIWLTFLLIFNHVNIKSLMYQRHTYLYLIINRYAN